MGATPELAPAGLRGAAAARTCASVVVLGVKAGLGGRNGVPLPTLAALEECAALFMMRLLKGRGGRGGR